MLKQRYVIAFLFILLSFSLQAQILGLASGIEVDVPVTSPGQTASFIVTLSNSSGDTTAAKIEPTFSNSNFGFLGGVFPGVGGDCTQGLGPGATCTMMLESKPVDSGDHDSYLDFSYSLLSFFGAFPPPVETARIKVDSYAYPTSCSLIPTVDSIGNQMIVALTTEQVSVTGSSFSPISSVSVPGLAVSNLSISDFGNLTFDLTAGAATGSYDLILSTECGSVTVTDGITVQATAWVDLRTAGGVALANPEFTTADINGFSINSSFGLQLDIANGGWNKALRFNGTCDAITSDFDIVVYRTGTARRLLVSLLEPAATIEPYSGGVSYRKQSVGYWNSGGSANNVYGADVDNGGAVWSQSVGTNTIQTGRFYRYHFESAGQSGNNLEIWEVDSNFNDIVQIGTSTVSTKPNSTSTNVCAGLSPLDTGNSDYYITGIRIQ